MTNNLTSGMCVANLPCIQRSERVREKSNEEWNVTLTQSHTLVIC